MKTIHQVLQMSEYQERGAFGQAFVVQGQEVQRMLDSIKETQGPLLPQVIQLARLSDIRALWMTQLQKPVTMPQVIKILYFHPKAALRACWDPREGGLFGFQEEAQLSILDALTLLLLDCPWPQKTDHLTLGQNDAFLEILRAQWERLSF